MEVARTIIDPGHVSADQSNKFAHSHPPRGASTRRQSEGLGENRSDESSAQENSSRKGAMERVDV
jgi:hypothetical protein